MRRVCVLILVIAVLASAQDWNVTSANWTFQGAFPANPNDPTFSGTCCLPAVMTMNVTMNGSNGIDFDIFYSNNPACGKVQNLQQHVKTAQFEGVSTSGKGGHLLLTYVTYWPIITLCSFNLAIVFGYIRYQDHHQQLGMLIIS
jgi:hypothetical protein